MRLKLKAMVKQVLRFQDYMKNDHIGAYASSSAYFIFLSFIPFLLLLLTLVQFTPLTKEMVTQAFFSITPDGFHALINGIIEEVYSKSLATVPVAAVMALWSSGKGLQCITKGLNVIYQKKENRNFVMIRLRAVFYTVIFIMVIVVTLLLMVFGNRIQEQLLLYFPFITKLTNVLLNMRVGIVTLVLAVLFTAMYKVLPNHTTKVKIRSQIPGALAAAVSWSVCSFVFSIYIDYKQNSVTMYGSLTTIVLILIWMYACMYLVLIGAQINMLFEELS